MPLRLCLPSGPPTTQCCISSFVRGSVSPPLTHYTMRLQIYFPFLSVPGNKDWKGHWDQDGQRLMSIADETAEGLFVGFDGAGEGVNSEEEEARWRAEREAAEREVARVRMRQE
ncbi:unnamed protein product [Brassica rapa]|uniref:Uncharacterized protein n=1 Tax=Brassica campestris TaxID=3711 RepID=A0A8D9DEQ3_BRACM|nr:unnamed protein product [Brassica rapa]